MFSGLVLWQGEGSMVATFPVKHHLNLPVLHADDNLLEHRSQDALARLSACHWMIPRL